MRVRGAWSGCGVACVHVYKSPMSPMCDRWTEFMLEVKKQKRRRYVKVFVHHQIFHVLPLPVVSCFR